MNDAEVKRRIESRRWAEETYGAAEDKPAFVQRVMQLGGTEPEKPKSIIPMTDAEVKVFRERVVFFGIHNWEEVGEISLRYLCRLADPSTEIQEFLIDLRRYLLNPQIKAAIERDES